MNTMQKTVCFVAGRSGGHIIPALTQAHKIAQEESSRIIFVTTDHRLDLSLLQNKPWIDAHVVMKLGNVPRRVIHYPLFLFKVCLSIMQVMSVFIKKRPQCVVSMGGYPSIPVCCAAWLLRIPFEVYELNVEPGAAVKRLAPFARKTYTCFAQTQKFLPHVSCTQVFYPVRFSESQRLSREQALAALGIPPNFKVMLVLGGSQGSQSINKLILSIAEELRAASIYIIHQTGPEASSIREQYRELGINATVFEFNSEMHLFYSAADVVIARAGAGTLFELLFFEKKSIIIPLVTATTAHQVDNAQAMAHQHPELFSVYEQKDLERDHTILNNAIKDLTT